VRGLSLAICLCVAGVPSVTRAQDGPPLPADVQDEVAKALYEQGMKLYAAGRYEDARGLFLESVQRSPGGAYAERARAMGKQCEAKLGWKTGAFDAPAPRPAPTEAAPIDPYAGSGGDGTVEDGPEPLNPYLDEAPSPRTQPQPPSPPPPPPSAAAPPTGTTVTTTVERGDDASGELDARSARRNLLVFGGGYGLWLGIAFFGATEPDDGAILPLMMAGTAAGLGAAWLGTRGRRVTTGQALSVMSGTTWGTTHALFLSHVADDPTREGDAEDFRETGYFGWSMVGGLVGLGAGIGYGWKVKPSPGDVAVVNSFGGYGLLGGLLLGGAIDPVQGRAYSLNSFLGSSIGLVAGGLLATEIETSRSRMAMLDLGVSLGALAPWVLVYPAIDGGDAVQVTSAVSLATAAVGGYLTWRWTRGMEGGGARRAAGPRLVPWVGPGEAVGLGVALGSD
jgi:hypothetical protein